MVETKQKFFYVWSDVIDFQKRGDVTYWFPEFLDIEKAVKRGTNLQDLLVKNITYGHTPLGGKNTYTNEGILFIRSGQLNDFFLDLTDNVYISENTHRKMQRSIIKGRDVLVATVGATIGAVAITPESIKEANCNQAVGILRSDEKKLNPYYLAIYLSSPYGKEQILRQSSGGARDNLDPFELKRVKIILPNIEDQKKVEQNIKEVFRLKNEAEADYQKALDLLSAKLVEYYKTTGLEKVFVKWSDTVDIIEKLHPLAYGRPQIKHGKEKIKVGDVALTLEYGTSAKLNYQESGVPFLRITDIDKNYQTDSNKLKYISNFEAEQQGNYCVDIDDVLISRTGTLGSAILIDEQLKDSIYGSYFIKVRFDDTIKKILLLEYLVFFLNSKIGKLQSLSLSSGGIQTNLTIQAIKEMEVPIIPMAKQRKIVDLVEAFGDKQRQSRQLLKEAKIYIEQLIETNV